MNRRADWNDLLRNCDFDLTAREVRHMLKKWKEEAASRGEEPYYSPEFLEALYPFLETPSLDTAKSLLEVAPRTYPLFEKCSQDGEFYAMNQFLNRGSHESKADTRSEPRNEGSYQELAAQLQHLEREAASTKIELPRTSRPTGRELRAAFADSTRPNAPAPPGWWVLPLLGVVMSLFVLGFNTVLGAVCLISTSSFFGACLMRTRRNRGTDLSAERVNTSGLSEQEIAVSIRGAVRILVVDDEEGIREAICAMLTHSGYACQGVAGGEEALDLLQSGAVFNLLMADILNSPMDGLTLLKRAKESFPDIPVVITTTVSDISVAVACAKSGADEYIALPVERDHLLASVSRALKAHEK